ncbi:MAG TPA: hypothetical protein VMD30_09840 [Tepidisphaeraceae bacterium]|nr:hypothetical protein [Tepidisphaeraceae bacterium]
MSSLSDPARQPFPAAPSGGQLHRPQYFVEPKKSLGQRINVQMIVFAVVFLAIIGAPFLVWLREDLNGGIVNHGDYYELDLKAMSDFYLDQNEGQLEDIPQKWRNMDGKEVELIGEMYAPGASDGALSSYQICFSRAKCCFSGVPLVQHFVMCHVDPGVTAYYSDGPVANFGILHVRMIKKGGKIISIYQLDVDHQEIE